ncbi:MAG: T9SS type A sorting domain-containing protein [Chitinophagales bacterium]|nr:T9SS type A sorting domain-containing protein [Chitinophagales bacterium]
MMKIYLLFLAILFAGSSTLSAQTPHRTCGTVEHLEWLKQQDPALSQRMQDIENFTQIYMAAHPSEARTIVTIPVVVHVVYNTSSQNISDAQVQAQISQLNQDYARTNSDAGNTPSVWQSTAVNTNVQFCLAQRDPNGNATTGIIHKSTSVTSFSQNDNVKHSANGGDDAWAAGSYLNLWVCNLGGGLLGYAQFPGGASSTDGVVILYSAIGSIASPSSGAPYNLGRTATHEVGHWLNLNHIWGDDGGACTGTDNVGDTPNQAGENYGCPAYPHTDACTASSPGVMFMNYMDYTDDNCMNMFTSGQSSRMNSLFASGGARYSITTSLGCTPPSGGSCGTPSGLSATSITTSSATLNWISVSGATSYNIQYRPTGTSTWTSTTSTTNSKAVSFLTASTQYEFQVQTVCSSGSSAYSASATFTTSSSGGGSYCASNGTTNSYEWIDYILLGSISRTSGADAGGYYNATSLTTNVSTSSSYTLTFSAGMSGGTYTEYWSVFIDWNRDGDFADAGETAYSTSSSSTGNLTATISVPSTASIGTTRMRVSMHYNSAPPSCGSFDYGEVEDYTLNIQQGSGGSCTESYESNNTLATAAAIPVNTNITSQISTSTDYDYFSFANNSTQKNIKVTLTTLPGDYDLKLYSPTGSLLSTSQNGGTTSETIIYNTSTIGTYKAYVYGYSGAYSNTKCYTLNCAISSSTFRLDPNIAISGIEEGSLSLYPNPVQNTMNVKFSVLKSSDISIYIVDMVGRLVSQSSVHAFEGENSYALDLNKLNNGLYVMQLQNGSGKTFAKFMIEK